MAPKHQFKAPKLANDKLTRPKQAILKRKKCFLPLPHEQPACPSALKGIECRADRVRFFQVFEEFIRIEVKEGVYARRVLYMEIRGQGAIPLTRTDENLTPREIEQKAAELAYFLRVPIEVF
ncbi:hypothetical protein V6N13_065608 [Hibiscus sabdariffa]